MKVVIVGGGAAGLAIGWRLAQSRCSVEILERGIAGRGSTWAAAGMLAAAAETAGEQELGTLARNARALWPAFAHELEQASGRTVSYRESGSLMVARDTARGRTLRSLGDALEKKGERAVWLNADNARRQEPLLSSDIAGALFAPDDAQVDNRSLGDALAEAFVRAGGRLRELTEMRALHLEGGHVVGVASSDGPIAADRVILAAGAWSGQVNGVAAEQLPPIRPAKGQMTALVPPRGEAMPRHLIWGEDVYLVPRQDSLLVGATVEDTGYETSVDRASRERLLARAIRLVPRLAGWTVSESWAGLRPRTPDSLPVLGETQTPGLLIASGQFRNGILFTPLIAELLHAAVLGEPSQVDAAFDARRFAAA
jgi:glycine oxidase